MDLTYSPKIEAFVKYDLSNISKLLSGEIQPPFPFNKSKETFDTSFVFSTNHQGVEIAFLMGSADFLILACIKKTNNEKVFFQIRKFPEGTFTLFAAIDQYFEALQNPPAMPGPISFGDKASCTLKVGLLSNDKMLRDFLKYSDVELQESLDTLTASMLRAELFIQQRKTIQQVLPRFS